MLRTLAAGALAAGILLAAAVPAGAQVTKNPKKATDLLPATTAPAGPPSSGSPPTPEAGRWTTDPEDVPLPGAVGREGGHLLLRVHPLGGGPEGSRFHYVFSCPSAPWA